MSDVENTQASSEITRPVLTKLNEDGTYSAESVLTPTNLRVRAECCVPSRVVIPVLFLPGIMGTRLRSLKNPDQAAWAPPEGTWEELLAALSYLGRSAAERQKMLDPDNTEVDDNGPAHAPPESVALLGDAPGDTDAERLKRRGWGQLHSDSYKEILNVLEQRLSAILSDGAKPDKAFASAVLDWQKDSTGKDGQTRTGAQRLGASKDFKPLDEDALKCAASAFYPVYAVGYNWLQSNKKSGEHLAKEVDRIVKFYRDRKKICEKVILVTHSMGGLVTRAGMQEAGMQEKILGVVHGVQPAIGAPAVYKRMRAGFEGAAQVILGRNAAQATAVLSNSPGGLELLPTKQYKSMDAQGVQRHWLRASHSVPGQNNGTKTDDQSTLLGEGDIYNDIYLNNRADSWWRMVKEELINPADREEKEKNKQEGKDSVEAEANDKKSDFDSFVKVMKIVRDLHMLIEDQYHPATYASFAADAGQPSWSEVQWKSNKPVTGHYQSAELVNDNLNGEVKIKVGERNFSFEIQNPSGPGDGTVPMESGAAPTPFVVQMFKHEGKAKGHTSYDHQFSFKADVVQATTLYSIMRIAADSAWLKANKDKA